MTTIHILDRPLPVAAFGLPKAALHQPTRQTPLSFRDLIRGSLGRFPRAQYPASPALIRSANAWSSRS